MCIISTTKKELIHDFKKLYYDLKVLRKKSLIWRALIGNLEAEKRPQKPWEKMRIADMMRSGCFEYERGQHSGCGSIGPDLIRIQFAFGSEYENGLRVGS